MENLTKAILDIFRTHNILLYVVCIASGLLSYNVLGLGELTGFANINSDYKNYIGLIFLISGITITVLCIKSIIAFFHGKFINNRNQNELRILIEEKIANLTNQEKAVLIQFFIQQSETIWLPFRTQEVVELINSEIISLASNSARMTLVGEAAMLKLSTEMKQKLAMAYPEIYSNNFDKKIVENLVNIFTPNSVREVIKDRRMFNY